MNVGDFKVRTKDGFEPLEKSDIYKNYKEIIDCYIQNYNYNKCSKDCDMVHFCSTRLACIVPNWYDI